MKLKLVLDAGLRPEAVDETVVHDPSGRPWLVCTTDTRYGRDAAVQAPDGEAGGPGGRYETQIFYTARGGIRGFPTGHGQRDHTREAALVSHRLWCLRVRTGDVSPDDVPAQPLQ